MKQTYLGGCHCGAVRYEVDTDLSQGALKCNCSICSKARAWLAAVDSADFRLLSGADALSEYQFGARRIHHLFCKHCGIKSFGRGTGPEGKEFIAILVSCLENVPDSELAALPVMYVDGRNDDFQSAPADTRHL
ncbi:MAG: GFA family protein [Steroidobacter sp.]